MRRLSSLARREEFIQITLSPLYYRPSYKGNGINVDSESTLLAMLDEFYSTLRDIGRTLLLVR